MKLIDLTGQRFGRLTVLERAENDKHRKPRWACRCDCGTALVVLGSHLRTAGSRSCGCLHSDIIRALRLGAPALNLRHGHSRARRGAPGPEYTSWQSAKTRCFNPRAANYSDYGGRGITMCTAWRESFESFLADMGPRPGAGYSLDRIDNERGYEPGNCRWATAKEQRANQRVVTGDRV